MFFTRNSPPTDPYTPLPKAPRGRATSNIQRDATRLRSASVSLVPEQAALTARASKRHTYHTLHSLPGTATAWNRVVSLPSPDETHATDRAPRSTASRNQIPLGDNPLHQPRRLQNSNPRTLLRTLNALLDPKSQRIPEFLDVDHLMALHERDLMERDQRDAIKLKARSDRVRDSVVCSGLTVFGSSLREATMFASNSTVLGGYEHDLPIVVFRCVQELCRHGFHPPKQPKPDRERLLSLIGTFDSEPLFGATTPLNCPSELREVCALLTTYLFALPEPVLSSEMFEAIWAWCVLPSLRSTDFLDDGAEDDTLRVNRHAPADATVHIAQLLLRLLPLPNFSLIVYMMGFFQRLPHMVSEDVGRAVFAGSCHAKSSKASDGRAERAATMLRWFLERWEAIFDELFAPQRNGTVDSLLSPIDPQVAPRTQADAESTPRIGPVDGGGESSRAPFMRLPSDGLFERAIGTESDASSISSSVALGERLLDVTLEFAEDAQRDERRWNSHAVLPPPQSREGGIPDNASDDSGYASPDPEEEGEHAVPPSPQPPERDVAETEGEMSHIQALRRISLLERELERSDVAVAEAISETFRARERVKELEGRLRGYEKGKGREKPNPEARADCPPTLELRLDSRVADDWHAVLQADTETLKRQLGEAQRERDAALQLVDEIKRLMGSRGSCL
ncbi:hypothetical protein K438DRAFT_1797714 [Mycena galopus ATCC 62051]|nr:hypothetical protein K438DRAFT_1797714 [Mycena galopus ATCC 62051]